MRLQNIKNSILLIIVVQLFTFTFFSYSQNKQKPEVTLIELGSVRCVPCIKMQKVIKQVEKKYPSKVKIIFNDVWTPEGKKASESFAFKLIPTQIFLDKNGKEFFRHEGYFEFDALDKILQQKLN